MNRPRTAERVVTPEQAQLLVESQFPELAPARVETFRFGWDNTVFLVNDAYVFRFPRREMGADALEAEIRVMPGIAHRLPLPVTAAKFIGRPSAGFPWSFAGYPMLEGRTACCADLDARRRARTAAPLGRFLAALHAIPAREAALHGAGPDAIRRLDLPKRVPRAKEHLRQALEARLLDDPFPWDGIIDEAARLDPPRGDTLVHGDLYARHLLVDGAGRLCGVIDWGDVHLGDAAVDLAIAHSFLPPPARTAFLEAYGPVDGMTWKRARFRAVSHSLVIALYGSDMGDGDLLRESLVSLRHAAENAV
jgi:aminoglycoside phosphotransferase (APT) family kinase protein